MIRVGVVVPGRVTVNWPLVGLTYDAEAFGLTAPRPIRTFLARALGTRAGGPSRRPADWTWTWAEVRSVRRIGRGAEVRLATGARLRVLPLAARRTELFLRCAQLGGVVRE